METSLLISNNDSFIINNFEINTTLKIKNLDNLYLSCSNHSNNVNFSLQDDKSPRQNWIIEKDDNDDCVFYIKNCFQRYNSTQYLGCPNQNNRVFLYTSKNKYTKWSIKNVKNNVYKINYIGEKFNSKEVSLIVARYSENIEWVLPYNDIAIIYNKGPDIELPFKKIVKVENIGREGHTYLYHIINNYENLIKKTFFLQGGPFEHNETILFGIDNYEKTLDVQPLGLQYLKEINIPTSDILNTYKTRTYYGLEYLILKIDPDCMYYGEYYFDDPGISQLKKTYKERFTECKSLTQHFLERSNFPITKPLDDYIRMTFCALFSVTSDKIKKYDLSVYQGLINELTNFNPHGGENGYILERLWLYIFEDEDAEYNLDLNRPQRIIISIFSGREKNLQISKKYLQKA